MKSHAGPLMEVELNNVMMPHEAAEYLCIPKSSGYKLAQEARIPCQKVGRHWRFRRVAIYLWLADLHVDNFHEEI